ncbi:AraC family transcriptional regulator N-terminal domain-containing protein [Paenibacillus taichungensis]|uniref:AraC family transcriptional regulator n=1 Tax=Paenibacillus taichungensis TaxID=484184 RepID=UPI0038D14665
MEKLLQSLQLKINQIGITEGKNTTNIPYLNMYRYSQQNIDLPEIQNPYILLVVSDTMRLHFSTGIKDYSPGEFLISVIDSPLSGHTLFATVDSPFLAISIDFLVDDVTSVMLDIDGDLPEKLFEIEDPSTTQQSNTKLLEVILRLIDMNDNNNELSFMSKHLKREVIFNLIAGPYGKLFLQSMISIQQAGTIYNINSWIKSNYKETFSMEDLAEQSNMSLSSFHQKFKTAVGMGPLQCQKKLRLLESRRLMLDLASNVTDAALEVGYESVSQFIRDYRRLFGRSPQKDVQEIRDCFRAGT